MTVGNVSVSTQFIPNDSVMRDVLWQLFLWFRWVFLGVLRLCVCLCMFGCVCARGKNPPFGPLCLCYCDVNLLAIWLCVKCDLVSRLLPQLG